MRTDRRRTVAGALVGVAMLGLLIWFADITLADLARIDPVWAALALLAYGGCLICRAFAMRAIAPQGLTAPAAAWLRLNVRHQFVFILAPSGAGDLAFPLLAKRYAGVSMPEAVRMLALTRMRDLVVVAVIGAAGLVMFGVSPLLGGAVIVLGIGAVLATERIASAAFRAGAHLWGETRVGQFLRACTDAPAPDLNAVMLRSGLILLAWICVGGSVYAAFAAVGRPLSFAETCLLLAALNVVGALAVSIGGLGVSEAGATGVLMLVGETAGSAAGFAVLARPLLLILMAGAALVLDLIAGLLVRGTRS